MNVCSCILIFPTLYYWLVFLSFSCSSVVTSIFHRHIFSVSTPQKAVNNRMILNRATPSFNFFSSQANNWSSTVFYSYFLQLFFPAIVPFWLVFKALWWYLLRRESVWWLNGRSNDCQLVFMFAENIEWMDVKIYLAFLFFLEYSHFLFFIFFSKFTLCTIFPFTSR